MSHNPNTLENRNGVVKTLTEWNSETNHAVKFVIPESPKEPEIEFKPPRGRSKKR